MRRRERRARALYTLEGYRPPEILDILVEEALFDDDAKRAASLKWVQEFVASIRAEAEPERILALQRPAETERYRQRLLKIAREELYVMDNDDEITRDVVTPKGDVATVNEPRFTADDKYKARKNYALVAEKLALLETVDVKGVKAEEVDPTRKRPGERSASVQPFQFVTSGKDLQQLIALNVEQGKVN